jgi:hypothetical protein
MWEQEGATKEEIDQLPKYKFQMIKELKKEGDAEESSRGVMTECDTDSDPVSEHVIALEDAVSSYFKNLFVLKVWDIILVFCLILCLPNANYPNMSLFGWMINYRNAVSAFLPMMMGLNLGNFLAIIIFIAHALINGC